MAYDPLVKMSPINLGLRNRTLIIYSPLILKPWHTEIIVVQVRSGCMSLSNFDHMNGERNYTICETEISVIVQVWGKFVSQSKAKKR